jgi:hypothetical protein
MGGVSKGGAPPKLLHKIHLFTKKIGNYPNITDEKQESEE